jgi:hypothetical protein
MVIFTDDDVTIMLEAMKDPPASLTAHMVAVRGLDAVASRIASRAVRKAAHDLDGSDPSIDLVVQWLLKRAGDIRDGVL